METHNQYQPRLTIIINRLSSDEQTIFNPFSTFFNIFQPFPQGSGNSFHGFHTDVARPPEKLIALPAGATAAVTTFVHGPLEFQGTRGHQWIGTKPMAVELAEVHQVSIQFGSPASSAFFSASALDF